jgi:hypothetical protein
MAVLLPECCWECVALYLPVSPCLLSLAGVSTDMRGLVYGDLFMVRYWRRVMGKSILLFCGVVLTALQACGMFCVISESKRLGLNFLYVQIVRNKSIWSVLKVSGEEMGLALTQYRKQSRCRSADLFVRRFLFVRSCQSLFDLIRLKKD